MKLLRLTAVVFVLLLICSTWALAEEERVGLCISDRYLDDAYGIMQNDTTLVPIRIINDELGLSTGWDDPTKCVTIFFGDDKSCAMYLYSNTAYITENGTFRTYELAEPPSIMDIGGESRAMVPLRFISEEMGLDVQWEGESKTVFINSAASYEDYFSGDRHYRELISTYAPEALMKGNNRDEYVPWDRINEYRYSGWFIKDYTYGLDDLSAQIKKYISGKNGNWGIYIKNLNTNEFAVINDGQYSSASIIKLFVMASVYNEMSFGGITKTPRVAELLKLMITESDNYSSNELVKIIGGGNYERGFNGENAHSHSVGAINTQHKSLFAGYGTYVSYGRNLVSPLDCGIMLEKIYRGELVSEEYSAEMLGLLRNQQRRWKIPYPLPSGTPTANKTGETSTVESDIAIVYSPACDYIICVLTNNASDGIGGIRHISSLTYNYFNG